MNIEVDVEQFVQDIEANKCRLLNTIYQYKNPNNQSGILLPKPISISSATI